MPSEAKLVHTSYQVLSCLLPMNQIFHGNSINGSKCKLMNFVPFKISTIRMSQFINESVKDSMTKSLLA